MHARLSSVPEEQLRADVTHAEAVLAERMRELDAQAFRRRDMLRRDGKPIPLIAGPHGAGKDEAALVAVQKHGAIHGGSTSSVLLPFALVGRQRLPALPSVADLAAAYENRHEQSDYLFDFGNVLRERDPSRLLRWALCGSDVIVGTRSLPEMQEGRRLRWYDLAVWVDNPRCPADPTLEFGVEECDVVLPNHATLIEFQDRAARLFGAIYR